LIDKAFAGGGGNPNVAKTDDQQKGDTTRPQPKPPEPKPPEPKPVIQKAPPKPEPKEMAKPEPKPKVTETAKAEPTIQPLALKPTTRTKMQREQGKTAAPDADAKRRQEIAEKINKTLGNAKENVVAGFKNGTKMEVWGPGGEAYAGYEAFVKAIYDDAWETSHLVDYDGAVRVTVTIRRTGDVISAYIVRGSGASIVDKSVQRALDKVKFVAPFPKESKDEQRTFNITFDLKAKRILG
jgi:periplasmic protein TonB